MDAFGCGVLIGILILWIIQASLLKMGARWTNVEGSFFQAFATVFLASIGGFVVQVWFGMDRTAEELLRQSAEQIFTETLVGLFVSVVVGTLAVTLIYSVPIVRGLLTYLATLLLTLVTVLALVLGATVIFWTVQGKEGVDRFFREAKSSYYERLENLAMWQRGEEPSYTSQDAVSLLEDVEFTEFENAVDVNVADAQQYIGRKVRIVHGPRRESIGTLKEVRSDLLIVAVKIDGGRVDMPVQKSKITTFQLVDR